MRTGTLGLALVATAGMMMPQTAAAETAHEARQLRSLDIMLMVSSLRCRMGPDNFQADYQRFTSRHIGMLNSAGHVLQADLNRRYGTTRGRAAFDRLSVGMANKYGRGHPWMSCMELKSATRDLAQTAPNDRASLLAAADTMLADNPSKGTQLALGH
ncbi:S-adenosyl-L-homocysteine hydrolase [Tsuneonella mangrovi]|uniref:S-adenosyl-L-homocysteine hydrolase n=1 Tax=Tsuneonella mangrovi TaxID=1982042 RepID=UPI0012376312|nr:S-adenosyl-L-homocysteine hydrolase [Tsuneonella mangrovi]